jgi:hypothetical protein
MVVTGGNVRRNRTEHVVGRVIAHAFLENVSLDFIDGHMAGSLNHHLAPHFAPISEVRN